MSKEKPKTELDLKSLPAQLLQLGATLLRYRVLLFVLLLCGVYGFVTYRIYSLSNQPAGQEAVQAQIESLAPHLDQDVAKRLISLKDNSVNVQALFDEARRNPFTE